ncbi:MAG: class I SAM-dependent methyltransferase [Desulfamplus sp.]|nr:class I SAM-dependent methyltransferase [Desulfamplus sp.]
MKYIKNFLAFFQKTDRFNSKTGGADKTAEKWAKSDEIYVNKGFKVFWETLEEVNKYQQDMISGGKDPLEYMFTFFPDGKSLNNLVALNIGCNFGEYAPPISMAKTKLFSKIFVVDISEELLSRQSTITNKLGLNHIIEYKCMDLNQQSLRGDCYYDLIFSLGTIHHINRLEGLFEEINRALKPDGVFCMREYIGPSYLQFTEQQVNIINEMLAEIPENLRLDMNGNVKNCAWRATLEEVIADDPSEAVRSSEIMDIIKMHLNIKKANMTGGTLLDSLLHGIADNFEKSELGKEVLKRLISKERELIENKIIPSDYVFLIAEKRLGEES